MSWYPRQYPVLERTEWRLEPSEHLKRGMFEDTVATENGPQVVPGKSAGVYLTPVIDAGQAVRWNSVSWEAELPGGSGVAVRIRVGSNEEECLSARWSKKCSESPCQVSLEGSRPDAVRIAAIRCIQVRVEMTAGTGGTPTLKNVSLACNLPPPACVGPMNRAVVDGSPVRFYWTRVEGAAGYSLELSRHADFSGDVGRQHGIVEPEFEAPGRLEPGTHYWRVRAIDGAQQPTDYSPVREFTVGDRPAVDASKLVHPYLFFNARDIPEIRERFRSRFPAAMSAILAKADAALKTELWDEKDVLLTPGQHSNFHPLTSEVARGELEHLAFAFLLTQDSRYLARATEVLLHLCGFSRWTGVPFGDPNFCYPVWQAALETAGVVKGVATAYDYLHPHLSDEARSAVREAILRLGLLPILTSWTDPRTVRYVPRHQLGSGNWWSVCNSGAGIAALSLLAEMPDALRWARMAGDAIRSYLVYPGGDVCNIDMKAGWGGQFVVEMPPNWGADGGYIESLGYVSYGLTNALYFIDAMKRVTGEDLSGCINEKLIDQAYYCSHRVPDGSVKVINFNDSGAGNLSPDLYALLARHTRSSRASFLLRYGFEEVESIHAALAADDSVEPETPDTTQANACFRDIGWCIFRSGWDAESSLMAAKFTQGRGHSDIGQFVIHYKGHPFVLDPGVTAYADPIYSGHLKTSRAHNLVLVDDQTQKFTDGRLLGCAEAPGIGVAEADLTAAYADLLESWQRTLIYLEPECFVVVDRLRSASNRTYAWEIHPAGRIAAQPGLGATLYLEQYEMQLRLLSPADWRISTRQGYVGPHSADYLSFTPSSPCLEVTFLAVFTGTERGRNIGVEKQETGTGVGVRVITPSSAHLVLVQAEEAEASAYNLETTCRVAAISRLRGSGPATRPRWLAVGSGGLSENGVSIAPPSPAENYRAGVIEQG